MFRIYNIIKFISKCFYRWGLRIRERSSSLSNLLFVLNVIHVLVNVTWVAQKLFIFIFFLFFVNIMELFINKKNKNICFPVVVEIWITEFRNKQNNNKKTNSLEITQSVRKKQRRTLNSVLLLISRIGEKGFASDLENKT